MLGHSPSAQPLGLLGETDAEDIPDDADVPGVEWPTLERLGRERKIGDERWTGRVTMAELTGEQRHRAAGVLLTMAAGDALGAGYEFGGPYPADMPVAMKGGGAFNWAPGEWTDDTQMALVIAQAALETGDLLSSAALDRIAGG